MKNSLKPFLAVLALGASAAISFAQAPKIMIVDMARLYDNHYKKIEQDAKLQADEQKAQAELERLNAQGNQLVQEYQELIDQTKNPALSDDAKVKAEQDAQLKLQDIQRKQQEVGSFRQNTATSLQQRVRTFRDLMLEEISKVATDVAKRRGAAMLLDKAGPTLIGISPVIYADTSFDITDEVMAEINKSKPADAPAMAPTAASATPAATTPEPETVRFPTGN